MSLHLSETQLLDAVHGKGPSSPHLDACPACRRRCAEWQDLIAAARDAATSAADTAVPDAHLAHQRREILAQLRQGVPNGRVLSFPHLAAQPTPPSGSAARWVAAAAAAGLIVGVFGGRLAHDLQMHTFPTARTVTNAPPVEAASTAEEQLLGEVEVVLRATGPAALGPLDALTPVAWDLRDPAP